MVDCMLLVKQKTAYEMRISDWSSDVCSADLRRVVGIGVEQHVQRPGAAVDAEVGTEDRAVGVELERQRRGADAAHDLHALEDGDVAVARGAGAGIAGGDAHAAAGVERVVDVAVLDDAGGDRIEGIGRERAGSIAGDDIDVVRVDQPDAGITGGRAGVDADAAQVDAAAGGLDETAIAATGAATGAQVAEDAGAVGAEQLDAAAIAVAGRARVQPRSEEHTSELQSLMRISYAVFCL